MTRPAAVVLVELIDAAEQTDDFVSGVVGLGEGRVGGERDGGPTRFGRWLMNVTVLFGFRQEHVARGHAVAYGPEQLRKASVEARRLAALVDELRSIDDPMLTGLVERLDELEVGDLSERLSNAAPMSTELRAAHGRLVNARSAMTEARARLVLGRHRSP